MNAVHSGVRWCGCSMSLGMMAVDTAANRAAGSRSNGAFAPLIRDAMMASTECIIMLSHSHRANQRVVRDGTSTLIIVDRRIDPPQMQRATVAFDHHPSMFLMFANTDDNAAHSSCLAKQQHSRHFTNTSAWAVVGWRRDGIRSMKARTEGDGRCCMM